MRSFRTAAVIAAAALALAGCGGAAPEPAAGGAPQEISGDIVVLTQRTDIVDTVFEDYKKQFNGIYPDVNVEFEAITDYENEVKIRMNSTDYGDVLLIPRAITLDQMPSFFEPLGAADEMSKKYRFISEAAFENKAYGIAITGNAQGFVYNKKIWNQAGITAAPKTPDEFLADLQVIKDKTDAIPLYTNYAAGWPLGQWEESRGGVSADPAAVNELATDDAPWAPGKEHFVIDSLLFDSVAKGLTEPDPATTEWELSKQLIADGKIATMRLGSWAVIQLQQKAANPADIGYLPFPTQVDGKFQSPIGGDFKNAINVHSENKPAARAWLDWFADKSNYATDQGGVSPLQDGPQPATLADFTQLGVETFELAAEPAGKEGLVLRIDNKSEIGMTKPEYRQRIVDAARGARPETKQQIFAELDQRWAAARTSTS
jgi:raffinose/stachyose/melibiose transport system substrate-binding protein